MRRQSYLHIYTAPPLLLSSDDRCQGAFNAPQLYDDDLRSMTWTKMKDRWQGKGSLAPNLRSDEGQIDQTGQIVWSLMAKVLIDALKLIKLLSANRQI